MTSLVGSQSLCAVADLTSSFYSHKMALEEP
jgi:hypothetical protein